MQKHGSIYRQLKLSLVLGAALLVAAAPAEALARDVAEVLKQARQAVAGPLYGQMDDADVPTTTAEGAGGSWSHKSDHLDWFEMAGHRIEDITIMALMGIHSRQNQRMESP